MSELTTTIEYHFRLQNGEERVFAIRLARPELELVSNPDAVPPDWTRLGYHQCPTCPLRASEHSHCPVAVNLAEMVDFCRDLYSTDYAEITVVKESREYRQRAPIQYGISSLMGLIMATSGCPTLDHLRPMVFTHLPFATVEEAVYRFVASYLVAQYFRHQRGQSPDWTLEHLLSLCERIGEINQAFAKRLLSVNPKDASLNALANLDCFSLMTAFSISQDQLKELECLFRAYA